MQQQSRFLSWRAKDQSAVSNVARVIVQADWGEGREGGHAAAGLIIWFWSNPFNSTMYGLLRCARNDETVLFAQARPSTGAHFFELPGSQCLLWIGADIEINSSKPYDVRRCGSHRSQR